MDDEDTLMERKHTERLERLAMINRNRLEESSLRKSLAAESADPRESVDSFLSSFNEQRADVEQGLSSARNAGSDAMSLKLQLDDIGLKLTSMQKLVAEASYFLPAYDVRSSQSIILRLKEQWESAVAELVPRKKFSFRNKATNKQPAFTTESDGFEYPKAGSESLRTKLPSIDQATRLSDHPLNSSDCIQNQESTIFVREGNSLGGELTLSSLSNCRVYLKGRITTLYVHTLRNCSVFTGPVSGSVFIENVQDSTLVLASHQIRIHSTKSTDFYLRVRSRPIVEYTTEVRFAPYAFSYTGIQQDLEATNLAEETGLWDKVDDFLWLRAVHSPNWTSIPVKERIPIEDGGRAQGVGCDLLF